MYIGILSCYIVCLILAWIEKSINGIAVSNYKKIEATATIYGHDVGQPVLASTPVKNWRILLQQRFTACMPLLAASSACGLWKRC